MDMIKKEYNYYKQHADVCTDLVQTGDNEWIFVYESEMELMGVLDELA